jgi:hypothetical protein
MGCSCASNTELKSSFEEINFTEEEEAVILVLWLCDHEGCEVSTLMRKSSHFKSLQKLEEQTSVVSASKSFAKPPQSKGVIIKKIKIIDMDYLDPVWHKQAAVSTHIVLATRTLTDGLNEKIKMILEDTKRPIPKKCKLMVASSEPTEPTRNITKRMKQLKENTKLKSFYVLSRSLFTSNDIARLHSNSSHHVKLMTFLGHVAC